MKLPEPAGWQWCSTHHFRKKLPKDAEKYCWEAVYTESQMRQAINDALEEAIDVIETANARRVIYLPDAIDLIRNLKEQVK